MLRHLTLSSSSACSASAPRKDLDDDLLITQLKQQQHNIITSIRYSQTSQASVTATLGNSPSNSLYEHVRVVASRGCNVVRSEINYRYDALLPPPEPNTIRSGYKIHCVYHECFPPVTPINEVGIEEEQSQKQSSKQARLCPSRAAHFRPKRRAMTGPIRCKIRKQ